MRNVYHIQDVTDLRKVIYSAEKSARGDWGTPDDVTVHMHRFGDECNKDCYVIPESK